MSLIDCRGDFVYAEFHEEYDFARAREYVIETASLCRQKKCKKLLIDMRAVTGKVSTWDRFKLAQTALQYYGWDLQVAAVYRAEEVNGFLENVVVNRGGNYRIFSNPLPACKWLGIAEGVVVVK